jgi:translation initiation factor IF-3
LLATIPPARLPPASRSSALLTPCGLDGLARGFRPTPRRARLQATGQRRAGFLLSEIQPGAFACSAVRRAGSVPPATQEVTAISVTRQPEIRINERIRVPQVRVIGDDGEQVGVLAVREALTLAQSKGLDLVEVSPTARPPVCRIMDYGKYKYEQNRRARKARKKQHVTQLKEIKMRPKIEDHDYGFKMDHARAFLVERNKVKFTVTFRGREMAHQEIGHKLIKQIIADLGDLASVESSARSEGRTLTMVVMPKPLRTPPRAEPKADAKADVKPASRPEPKPTAGRSAAKETGAHPAVRPGSA